MIIYISIFTYYNCTNKIMPSPRALLFQNLINEISIKMELLFYLAISQILFAGLGVLVLIVINYFKGNYFRYEKTVPYHELLWTMLPTFILLSVAIPSISLLYYHELEPDNDLTIKITAHQWYWSYEYRDFENIELDAFIKPTDNIRIGENRLLERDNRVVLPIETSVRLLITSEDVLHAWALPAIGVKIDAIPGRINSIFLFFKNVGFFYGQCRELCGANHSFIPITVETTLPVLFKEWIIK